jgi:cytochrome c-type protein NapB
MRPEALALVPLVALAGCTGPSAGPALPRQGTPATVRAERRAYDGAPPVIPHPRFSRACESCHEGGGVAVPGLGVAPASPHGETRGIGASARCGQCHVERTTSGEFRVNRFEGRPQQVRHRAAATAGGPPVMPHPAFMRESCAACHAGPGARSEIRTTHPERKRCRQCHVERSAADRFGVSG